MQSASGAPRTRSSRTATPSARWRSVRWRASWSSAASLRRNRRRALRWPRSRRSTSAWRRRWRSLRVREGTHRGARLLLVDDNKVNRLLLARNLELQGHQVAAAENGRVALDMLRREAFDLLLLDIEMPEMNGFQVLEQLKGDLQLRDIP